MSDQRGKTNSFCVPMKTFLDKARATVLPTSTSCSLSPGLRREIFITPMNCIASSKKQNQQQQLHYHLKTHRMILFYSKLLCQAKNMKWQFEWQKKLHPLVCIPYTVNDNSKELSNLNNLLNIYNFDHIQKSMFGTFFDSLKFFYQQKEQEFKYIHDEVLMDEVVVKAINATAREVIIRNCSTSSLVHGEENDKELKIQQEKAKCILMIISSKVKSWVYKVVGWFTFRMVSLFATSLIVQPNQIDRVREAEQSGLPIIYLPLHKSHMDYILLGLVLSMHNIKPPLVAAGENLRVFIIGNILSYLGAFYIKRRIDKKNDQLYWTILSSYIKNSMKNGHHIEFFLEGARTRSGKCCVPKGGLLSIIVDAYREGVIKDAWIVPVSMNYDRILEGNFVREELGQPKKKETFFIAISTFIKAVCSDYGIMRVDFNIPYKLGDLYESINKKIILENEALKRNGLEVMPENIRYKYTIDGIAKHIIYDCWKSTAIMSTNAVCFLLLKKYRNGTTLEQLAEDLSIMRDKLSQANRDVGFSSNSKNVIEHALNLLVPRLVSYEKSDEDYIVKPILDVSSLIELSYYGNSLLSHYYHLSIVALALSKLVCPEFWNKTISETKISRNELDECVTFLTGLLQFDFVFMKPCDSLSNIVDTVIRNFKDENIILQEMLLDEEKLSHNVANLLDEDSYNDYQYPSVIYDIKYRVNANESSLNEIKFYRSIMLPYLECMAECARSFLAMTKNSVPEHEHIQTILKQMHKNLDEGNLFYGESISVETIKHSFLSFEKLNCLSITMKDNIKILSLINNELHNLSANMQTMSDYIEKFLM